MENNIFTGTIDAEKLCGIKRRDKIDLSKFLIACTKVDNLDTMLSEISTSFHKHAVDIEDLDDILDIVESYLLADYYGYGRCFKQDAPDRRCRWKT